MLCNTMLITGPPGVGKTAAVYACAQELGFKVFEVNASSQRSGRLILSQLKEATQSHQVDSQGVNAHKPTYFNSYSTSGSSSVGSIRPGTSPSMWKALGTSILVKTSVYVYFYAAETLQYELLSFRENKLSSQGGVLSQETSPVAKRC